MNFFSIFKKDQTSSNDVVMNEIEDQKVSLKGHLVPLDEPGYFKKDLESLEDLSKTQGLCGSSFKTLPPKKKKGVLLKMTHRDPRSLINVI